MPRQSVWYLNCAAPDEHLAPRTSRGSLCRQCWMGECDMCWESALIGQQIRKIRKALHKYKSIYHVHIQSRKSLDQYQGFDSVLHTVALRKRCVEACIFSIWAARASLSQGSAELLWCPPWCYSQISWWTSVCVNESWELKCFYDCSGHKTHILFVVYFITGTKWNIKTRLINFWDTFTP